MKIKIGRSFFIRIAAIIILILIGVWMFFIGKQHTILLDNNRNGDYRALDEVEVIINGNGVELYSRMRDQAKVSGQTHRIQLIYEDDNGETVTLSNTIHIPLGEDYMLLSIPYLVNNPNAPQDEWLTHFESMATTSTVQDTSDEVVLDEMAGLGGF